MLHVQEPKKDLVIIRIIKSEEEEYLLKYFNKDTCQIYNGDTIKLV